MSVGGSASSTWSMAVSPHIISRKSSLNSLAAMVALCYALTHTFSFVEKSLFANFSLSGEVSTEEPRIDSGYRSYLIPAHVLAPR